MAEFLELNFNFSCQNLEPFFRSNEAAAELDTVLQLSAQIIRGIIIEKISQHGTGRIYKRGDIVHQASSPGDPPATDTGFLKSSIGINQEFLFAEIIANTNYAGFLEDGTSKMKARPYMKPSMEEAIPQVTTLFDAALRRVLKL